MIQLLATRYNKHIAYLLGLVFYLGFVIPVYGMGRMNKESYINYVPAKSHKDFQQYSPVFKEPVLSTDTKKYLPLTFASATGNNISGKDKTAFTTDRQYIDGPSQPEMSSFKAAGTSDMVNLFTGDFSYNIPLLDVGGYPVNIFYNGGISMEQEASWVGLGWNINPGNINRNMRGVPDDFNGEDTLIQEQNMKKNTTWGVSAGIDLEIVGIKNLLGISLGASAGFSVNNYLGPAVEMGIKGGASFSLGGKSGSEKSPIGASIGIGANVSSRNGLTFSGNASLSAKSSVMGLNLSQGVGLSTSYNSRTGIKGLQLYEQVSASYNMVKGRNDYYELGEQLNTSSSMGSGNFSTSISFTRPSYVPSMRSVITNSSGAGRFQLGVAMFGLYPSLEIEGYGQKSEIASEDRVQKKPMIGYLYAEEANGNRNAIMDFTRFNDKEVTPSTTVISVPQYSYDVFSIQGEGTGGAIRFYRNDNGYVKDNFTTSKDKSWSAGIDVGIPGHIGVNFNTVKTPSTIGEWNSGNKLRNTIGFTTGYGRNEHVYFRNPGENSVLQPNQYDSIGGTDLVRYKLGGTELAPTIEPKLLKLNPDGSVKGEVYVQRSIDTSRKKRTQVTSFLTAKEAGDIGLDKKIKVYDPQNFLDAGNGNKLKILQELKRDSGYRKSSHISQINVTEADGKRYVYGIPVYNLIQKDFSFTVADNCADCDIVPFNDNEATLSSSHINGGIGSKDGYTQITTTPPYAHSFLLSGLLSPDYVDVTGNGITEDDLGGAIKFNYSKNGIHKWRTPLLDGMHANSNPGNLTEKKDDKGIVSYGERESWYLHSIESKTMIAFFALDNTARADGKGADAILEDVKSADTTIKRLKQIDLYNKADLKKNGLAGAKPVKTVHFEYNYSLCEGTPDNYSGTGKLTLQRIWFTYNGQNRNSKNQYLFSYALSDENPDYVINASDRWGNYKPHTDNPADMMNRDYPYAVQDKTKADQHANAWSLKKILLPSGGQMEITYESDDYGFVQDKRAAVMSEVIGFGNTSTNPSNKLYELFGPLITENDYLFVRVTEECSSKLEVYEKYLKGVAQLAVKLTVNMPKGYEHLISYASFNDYGVYSGAGFPAIWIRMNKINGFSPLSQTAIEFLREQLPGQVFPGYDVSDDSGIEQALNFLKDAKETLASAFSDMANHIRRLGLAQTVQVNKSFVRLNDPDGFKYGGGQRVKKVMMKDNWKKMMSPNDTTQGYTSVYGLEYDYTTTETFNGVKRTISSGVASYEPSIGGEENPFQTIIQIADKVPLGPTSYGAIEMPVMDAFFPAPLVGYSKVTVTSLGKKQNPDTATKKTRSGVGKQVSEFYTAKDFPVSYNYTPLDAASNVEKHINPTLAFFYKYAFDGRAISQGFLVATNDMHGKTKSQSSYAENDLMTPINYTQNFYRNTGAKGLDEKFDFIYNDSAGKVQEGNMGIDIELMTDTREFSVKSKSKEIQAQVDWMIPAPLPIWLPFIWGTVTESENVYRAVTTTKVISYHAVLDSVVVIDKGSQVSTRNLVYDAETGQVIVNRTNNEFEKPIYSVNYPAYWAYSGMGLAYKNIDAVYSDIDFLDGKIVDGISTDEVKNIFESGDELYIKDAGTTAGCSPLMVSSAGEKLIWALDKNKSNSSLTNINPDFIFIDSSGKPYTRSGVKFRIVRSGKRNMLGAPVAAVTLMTNPVDPTTHKFTYSSGSKVVNASAVEYKEKWQTDNDVIQRYSTVTDTVTCEITEVENCSGYLDKSINPYRKGIIGNFRGYRNMVFYGERIETDPTNPTNLLQNGFLAGFSPYWNFNTDKNLAPDISNAKWVWNAQSTRFNSKGMELETKNALDIYTSAQYGYNKTLPVAITNNSRYDEMFYEGFEDYNYNDLLNNSGYNNCTKKHIGFNAITNSELVNTDEAGFNAHTGKYVLGINTQEPHQLSIPVTDAGPADFGLHFKNDTIRGALYDEGVVIDDIWANPDPIISGGLLTNRQVVEAGTGYGIIGDAGIMAYSYTRCDNETCTEIQGSNPTNYTETVWGSSLITGHQYIEIKRCGSYQIDFDLFTHNNSSGAYYLSVHQSFKLIIRDLDGNLLKTHMVDQNEFEIEETWTTFLDKGVFLFSWESENDISFYQTDNQCSNNGANYSNECRDARASFAIHWPTGQSTPSGYEAPKSYKTLATLENCYATRPMAATDSMINPIFSIPAAKKMLFSAWVRESDTQVPAYTNNEVQIDFGSGNVNNVTIKPAGPVIEGWQRYEGSFTTPAAGATMILKLINNSGSTIYFDDIRIHPFNANMQSYVYDPVNLRLTSQLDANNYASFYEYDEEGTLIRTKVETQQGIKTVTESRSAKQKNINDFQ